MAVRGETPSYARAYVVLLAGGIASGKSTVARMLERRGAVRIDLDALSREVTSVGSPTLGRLACEFGEDVLDDQGALRRFVLAERAFANEESTRALEDIVHPAIRELLKRRLGEVGADGICVVEVPLLDRVEDFIPQADEVLCVICPLDERRRRACLRGMTGDDFDARVRLQPSDEYLVKHATSVLVNDGDEEHLRACVDAWWRMCAKRGWEHENGHT